MENGSLSEQLKIQEKVKKVTVKDLLESEEVKENICEYNQIIIVHKGKSYAMKDDYLNCQVEGWMPSIDLNYGLGYPHIYIYLVNGLTHSRFLLKSQKSQIFELSKRSKNEVKEVVKNL